MGALYSTEVVSGVISLITFDRVLTGWIRSEVTDLMMEMVCVCVCGIE